MSGTQMIAVENINAPGRTSNVNAEKYTAMRTVLLKVLPPKPPGMTQAEMVDAVRPHLSQTLWPDGEKAMWWVKTVQLDLEAKGRVIRNATAKPIRWYRG